VHAKGAVPTMMPAVKRPPYCQASAEGIMPTEMLAEKCVPRIFVRIKRCLMRDSRGTYCAE